MRRPRTSRTATRTAAPPSWSSRPCPPGTSCSSGAEPSPPAKGCQPARLHDGERSRDEQQEQRGYGVENDGRRLQRFELAGGCRVGEGVKRARVGEQEGRGQEVDEELEQHPVVAEKAPI